MCQGPSGGPESRATNSCQFAQDIPDFSTVSPRAQKTPQCHADWDAWSPRGGVTSWEHPLQKLFQPNPYLKLYVGLATDGFFLVCLLVSGLSSCGRM